MPRQDSLRTMLIDHFANSMPVAVDRDYAENLLDRVIEAYCTDRERSARIDVWSQIVIETRACVCDCGQEWSKSDLGVRAKETLQALKQQSSIKEVYETK